MIKKQISKAEFNRRVIVETNYQRFVKHVEAFEAKKLGFELVSAEYEIDDTLPSYVELT